MRVLITGATGFVGTYLMEHHIKKGDIVLGAGFLPTVLPKDYAPFETQLRRVDIRYREQIDAVVDELQPDLVYHLAAQSYPALSWKMPAETLDTNVKGTSNVFESIKRTGAKPRVVVACSSAQYGYVPEHAVPISETYPMRPLHPYGVSKLATEALAIQHFENDGIQAVCARIFNTTGPRKQGDVCADFTRRAVDAERGLISPILKVGNLTTRRAITDVRDLVSALVLLGQKGQAGQAYNVSGEKTYLISDLLDLVKDYSVVPLAVVQDPNLMRPSDEPVIFGDSSKLKTDTNWVQTISIEKTLTDMLSYWRNN